MPTLYKKILLLFYVLFAMAQAQAQVVYEPNFKSSYDFLSRMAQRGIITLDDVVLPLSRSYVQDMLSEIYLKSKELTPLETKELNFYLKDYLLDRVSLDTLHMVTEKPVIFKKLINDRWRMVSYRNRDFNINLQPVIGADLQFNYNGTTFRRSSGFWLYGYIKKNFGFSFLFNEVGESGVIQDYKRTFTPEQGYFGLASSTKINYSDFKTNISYNWKWGVITTGRETAEWGYGAHGKLVLSNKAPAYPFVRTDIKPIKWLTFNQTLMWLSSGVVDSNYVRPTTVSTLTQIDFVPKFMRYCAYS